MEDLVLGFGTAAIGFVCLIIYFIRDVLGYGKRDGS